MPKAQRQFNGERIVFSISGTRRIEHPYEKKKNPDINWTSFTKINSKWIIDIPIKCTTIKFREKTYDKI